MNADRFAGTVEKYKKIRHINTQEQLRAHTTCGSSTTFRKYLKQPELMPLGIYHQIASALNIPREEQEEMIFGKDRK